MLICRNVGSETSFEPDRIGVGTGLLVNDPGTSQAGTATATAAPTSPCPSSAPKSPFLLLLEEFFGQGDVPAAALSVIREAERLEALAPSSGAFRGLVAMLDRNPTGIGLHNRV